MNPFAEVQTGRYSAASKSPTTAALTPRSIACAQERRRSSSQNGNGPMTSRKVGRNMATRLRIAPVHPFGDGCMTVPR
jgi:hypothetical protein